MKKISFTLLLLIMAGHSAFAETFIETITKLSARDAVTIYNDQLYASNYNTGAVYRISLNGDVSSILDDNARGPAGIRVGNNGDVFIALYNEGSIIRVDSQGNESIFATSIREPIALDWDNTDNLYVSHFAGNTTVSKVKPDGSIIAFAEISQLTSVSSLCLDDQDNVYVTSYFSSDIYKVTPAGNISLFATTDLPGYGFLQFDAKNSLLYATVTNTDALISFDLDGNMTEIINSADGGADDGPLASATIDRAIGLSVSDDGKHVYFATNTHIRRLNIADPSVDQVRPYFTSNRTAIAEQDEEFSHDFEFIDPNDDPLMLTLESVPNWLQFDGVSQLSGTPGETDAGQEFVISAMLTDNFSTTSQSFTITVNAATAPQPPATPVPTPTPIAQSNSGGTSGVWVIVGLSLYILLRRFRTFNISFGL